MAMYSGKLWVVQAASLLSDKVRQWAGKLSKEDYWTFGSQLVRSADSIGANLAEGFGRKHRADVLRFYTIAQGSLEETLYWIRRARARNAMGPIQASDLINSYLKLHESIKRFSRPLDSLSTRRSRP
jgi:four helix bundle protein